MKNERSTVVIATSGLIASGKSSLLRNLAQSFEKAKYSCLTIRSDAMRIEEYTEAMFFAEHFGDPDADYNQEIWNRYFEKLQKFLHHCDVILLDAGHSNPESRTSIEELCLQNKADFIGLRLMASEETCKERLLSRPKEDYSVATLEHLQRQIDHDYGSYSDYWYEIDAESDEDGVFQQAKKIVADKLTI